MERKELTKPFMIISNWKKYVILHGLSPYVHKGDLNPHSSIHIP